ATDGTTGGSATQWWTLSPGRDAMQAERRREASHCGCHKLANSRRPAATQAVRRDDFIHGGTTSTGVRYSSLLSPSITRTAHPLRRRSGRAAHSSLERLSALSIAP